MPSDTIVLMPVYHSVNYRLQNLLHQNQVNYIQTHGTSDIAFARSKLLTQALKTKADRFLWIDSDMIFASAKDLFIMLTHDEPLVSGIYVTGEGQPCLQPEVPQLLPDEGLIPIKWAGFGCVSMAREVAEAVVKELPLLGRTTADPVYPAFFPLTLNEAGAQVPAHHPDAKHWYTEDMAFFYRAKMAGFQAQLQCDIRLFHLKEVPIPVNVNKDVLMNAKGIQPGGVAV